MSSSSSPKAAKRRTVSDRERERLRVAIRDCELSRESATDEQLLSFCERGTFGDDPARYANCGDAEFPFVAKPSEFFKKALEVLAYPNDLVYTSLYHALTILRVLESYGPEHRFDKDEMYEAFWAHMYLVADHVATLPRVNDRLFYNYERELLEEICSLISRNISDRMILAHGEQVRKECVILNVSAAELAAFKDQCARQCIEVSTRNRDEVLDAWRKLAYIED